MSGNALLSKLSAESDEFGPAAVDRILAWAIENEASDLHLLPTSDGLSVLGRVAGELNLVEVIPVGGDRIVARLKVLAGLLTYRTDAPQEGRIAAKTMNRIIKSEGGNTEVGRDARLATCPTVLGEKAVLRLFPVVSGFESTTDLQFDSEVTRGWNELASEHSGMLLITGPAGSGKTTTAYATIRSIMASAAANSNTRVRSVVSLEDPVEQVLDGVAQTSVGGTTGITFADGLRAILRHDPEVIFIGELRDRDTIDTAIRASLTGHLVIATMHAGSAAEAVVRLFDAEVDLFLVLSGLLGVLNQRLLRGGNDRRHPVAELLDMRGKIIRDGLSSHRSTAEVEKLAVESGMTRIADKAQDFVTDGQLDEREFAAKFGSAIRRR